MKMFIDIMGCIILGAFTLTFLILMIGLVIVLFRNFIIKDSDKDE